MKLLFATIERQEDRRFGIGRSLERICASLRARGVEVVYLDREAIGPRSRKVLDALWRSGHALWRRSGKNHLLFLAALLERLNMGRLAAKVARREAPGAVLLQDPFLALGYLLFSQGRGARFGILYHAFGSYAFNATHFEELVQSGWQLRLLLLIERWVVRRCAFVVTTTELGRRQLARDLALWPIPERWHLIPHPRPEIEPIPKGEARRRLGLPEGGRMVLAVGRGRVKRFGRLLESFALLSDPSAFLVLVGPGEDPELLSLGERLGLSGRLHLRLADQMAPYFRAADLYVSLSEVEAFGLANLEALVAGLPVVATATGGVPEVVGPAALLLPPSAPKEQFAQAMALLLSDPLLRQRLRAIASSWCSRWPTAGEVAEAYLALFRGEGRDLLPEPSPAPPEPPTFLPSLPDWLRPLPETFGRIVCFAPHPDDESLGMGGTLARLAEGGGELLVVLVTGGQAGDPAGLSRDVAGERLAAFREALSLLGVGRSDYWGEEDGRLDWERLPHLRARAKALLEQFRPDALFLPPLFDYHRDHLFTALAVLEAWRELGSPGACYFYEVGQPHLPTHFCDISAQLEKKRAAIARYRLEQRYLDLASVSEALMTFRTKVLASQSLAIETFMQVDPESLDALIASMLTLRKLQESAGEPP